MLKAYLICKAIEMLKAYLAYNRQIEAKPISFTALIRRNADAAYLYIAYAISLYNNIAERLHKCIAEIANCKLSILKRLICKISATIMQKLLEKLIKFYIQIAAKKYFYLQ